MLAVLNASGLSAHACESLSGGPSALERAYAFARSLPDVSKVAFLVGSDDDKTALSACAGIGEAPVFSPIADSYQSLVAELDILAEGFDSLYYMYADCPFLDSGLSKRLWENHQEYSADYSFADGYSYGVAPELLRRPVLKTLALLAAGFEGKPGRDALFSIIQKDINGFDIETDISPVDLRPYRLSLTCDCKRNRLLVERLMEAGARDVDSLLRIIPARRDMHRTLPAFFGIQIVSGCPQACSSCPYPVAFPGLLESREWMPLDRFSSLMESISRFSQDAVIDLSLWGEPALHPDFPSLAAFCLCRPAFRLVVETSGIGWKPGILEALAAAPGSERIDWIVSLDALKEDSYLRLRGQGYAQAISCVERLMGLFPGRVHVQALRMTENEEEIESFYRHWKEKTKNVIIQKYDCFCGLLPERRVTDLSPLVRHECRHLQRDMSVLLDGRVPLCREDVAAASVLGNAFEEDLALIWERASERYRAQVGGDYQGICARCDEYYTYNF
jgi:spiro-SPASM protein